ncbi:hypothetical protein VHEMI01287 [[Torrubiella] hemipterigena]|uniref:Aminoglycoside phosphotransferase domain-containing protein n=1 Tax=[Torrubiella] hemipterigena TaxID=1531966 RepID=A0A0A1T4E5_9HYPO|nr:hypothetical protein VHEMI01287 [[Torrubiella] hemipterigena]
MPKTNVSMEDSVRVRNEVVFLAQARKALGAVDGHAALCPRAYAWDDTNLETQFIVEEFKNGEHILAEEFSVLSPADQTHIFTQIAKFVKALQTIKLPEGVVYGGLTFDGEGVISSTKCPIPCGGPFKTERSKHLNGWKGTPKLRERLEVFFANGRDKVLQTIGEDRPTLTHADLGMGNLLFDRETKTLTAVIDFDFSHAGSPVSEYLFSFYDVDYLLTSSVEPNGPMRGFLLDGFPEGDEHKGIDSENVGELQKARRFDTAFASQGVPRPSTIGYAAAASDIWWF